MTTSSRGILTGAHAAVAALEGAGVEMAFGLPGVHNLASGRPWPLRVRLVGVRHEQTAVYAADGYARASGGLGVAITTTGPGAANTLAPSARHGPRARRCSYRHRHPHQLRRARALARRPARGHRPGGDVRAGDQGDDPRDASRDLGTR